VLVLLLVIEFPEAEQIEHDYDYDKMTMGN